MRASRSVVSGAMVVALALGACATAGPRPGMALAGTWELVAANDRHPDGSETPAYGAQPRGVLMVAGDGRYSLQIFRSDRARFAANVKSGGTPEEMRAAVLGESTHFGTCAVRAATHTLEFRIDAASYPNWNGTVQVRPFTLVGDELRYEVPATAANTGSTPVSVWRRVGRS